MIDCCAPPGPPAGRRKCTDPSAYVSIVVITIISGLPVAPGLMSASHVAWSPQAAWFMFRPSDYVSSQVIQVFSVRYGACIMEVSAPVRVPVCRDVPHRRLQLLGL